MVVTMVLQMKLIQETVARHFESYHLDCHDEDDCKIDDGDDHPLRPSRGYAGGAEGGASSYGGGGRDGYGY